uniref:Uncharacterized protein n=1 Tax=Oryza barthii TaxID=65489 RepID=A0A0D3HIR7_9ORYZ
MAAARPRLRRPHVLCSLLLVMVMPCAISAADLASDGRGRLLQVAMDQAARALAEARARRDDPRDGSPTANLAAQSPTAARFPAAQAGRRFRFTPYNAAAGPRPRASAMSPHGAMGVAAAGTQLKAEEMASGCTGWISVGPSATGWNGENLAANCSAGINYCKWGSFSRKADLFEWPDAAKVSERDKEHASNEVHREPRTVVEVAKSLKKKMLELSP